MKYARIPLEQELNIARAGRGRYSKSIETRERFEYY